jgi:hypothetical protein
MGVRGSGPHHWSALEALAMRLAPDPASPTLRHTYPSTSSPGRQPHHRRSLVPLGRRDQVHLVAEIADRPSPVVPAGAGFHSDPAAWLAREEDQHLLAPKPLAAGCARPLGLEPVRPVAKPCDPLPPLQVSGGRMRQCPGSSSGYTSAPGLAVDVSSKRPVSWPPRRSRRPCTRRLRTAGPTCR